MSISTVRWFKELAINKQLCEEVEYYDKLVKLVDIFKDKLNATQWFVPVAFTPHDFNHHVRNVLTNASKILEEHLDAFQIDELFCLQCACVLHDLSMAYSPYKRPVHGYDASSIISSTYNLNVPNDKIAEITDQLSVIEANEGMPASQDILRSVCKMKEVLSATIKSIIPEDTLREGVAWIVLGHCDVKAAHKRINTLEKDIFRDHNVFCRDTGELMRLRELSAVLRWADELDCSVRRIDGEETPYNEDCIPYWDKLKLVKNVSIKSVYTEITINSEILDKEKKYVFKLINEVCEKLNRELEVVNQCLNDGKKSLYLASINYKWLSERALTEYNTYIKDSAIRVKSDAKMLDEISSQFDVHDLVSRIQTYIHDRHLLVEGHFLLHYNEEGVGNVSIRNYLDCGRILGDAGLMRLIVTAFTNYMFTGDFEKAPDEIVDKYVLIGIANTGAQIAASIATISGLSFSYIVPVGRITDYTTWERDTSKWSELLNGKEIVIIQGVNHTGVSLINAVKNINEMIAVKKVNSRITKVVGLINREQVAEVTSSVVDELKRSQIEAVFLINGYPVEKCSMSKSEQCIYSKRCLIGRGNKDESN